MRNELLAAFKNAPWPVLLLDAAGTGLRANIAATQLLGPAAASGSAHMATFWMYDGSATPETALSQWTRAPTPVITLPLRIRGGQSLRGQAWICAWLRDQERFSLLQFPPSLPQQSADAQGPAPGLENLLQFARTIALDFNNALTALLARTSLRLTQLAENHPIRQELLGIEQAAARAAEIAHEPSS